MSKNRWVGMLGLGMSALIISGCVNHVKEVVDTKVDVDRQSVSTKYYVTLTPDMPVDSLFLATVEKNEILETKTYEITVGKKYFIPYTGWRKSYEIPGGLALLPCSLISHVGFLGALGIWDYDFTWDITCKAFAGLNPFMNWESEAGTVEELTSADKKLVKTEQENRKELLAKSPVTVKAGNLSKTYITDEFGSFNIYLLSLNAEDIFLPLERKISFFPADSKGSAKDIILQREFVAKLLAARDMINAYMVAPTGKKLIETINALEKSGFTKLAYELEMREKKRHATNEFFMKEFRDNGGEL